MKKLTKKMKNELKEKYNAMLNEKHDCYVQVPGEVINAGASLGNMTLRDAMNKLYESAQSGTRIYIADEYDPLDDSGYTNIYCIDDRYCEAAYVHRYDDDYGWCWIPLYKTICETFEEDYGAGMIPCCILD